MMQAVAADTSHVITTIAATTAGHRHYFLAGLIAIVVLEAVAIVLLIRHKGWELISTVPTTALRTVVSISLFAMFNVSVISVGYLTGTYPPEYALVWMESFICVAMGIDVAQFAFKRFSTDANIPSIQNVQGGITQGPAQSPPAPQPTPAPITSGDVPVVPATPQVPSSATVHAMPSTALAALATHAYEPGN